MANTIKLKQLDQAQLASFISEMLDGTGAVYTASRAVVTDVLGDITTSSVTSTELGYLSGVSSAVQTQLNAKLGTSLTSAYVYVGNGSNVATGVAISGDISISNAGVTAIGASKVTNSMLAGSIAAAKLVGTDIVTVGTITTGVWNGTAIAVANGGTGATTASAARSALGLVIGTDVAAQSSLASYLPLTGGTLTATSAASNILTLQQAASQTGAAIRFRNSEGYTADLRYSESGSFRPIYFNFGTNDGYSGGLMFQRNAVDNLWLYPSGSGPRMKVYGGNFEAFIDDGVTEFRMMEFTAAGILRLSGPNAGDVEIYSHTSLKQKFTGAAFYSYHAFTDASNYQGAKLSAAAGAITLEAVTAGAGADDINILLTPAGAGNVTIVGGATLVGTGAAPFSYSHTALMRSTFSVNSATTSAQPEFLFERKRAGSYDVDADDFMGGINCNTVAFFEGIATADVASGYSTVDWRWRMYSAAGVTTERMRLTAEGRLGIGTGSPASLLHVAGDAKVDGNLTVTGVVKAGTNNYISLGEHTQTTGFVNLATNGDAALLIGSNLRLTNGEGGTPRIVSSHGSLSGAAIIIPGAGNTRQGTIEFWTTPTGAVTAGDLFAQTDPRAVITNTGLVGINTTSPVFRLDVGAGSGSYLDAFRIGFALIGGHSGTDYDSIGYNTRPTTSGGLYNYAIADTACRINFYNGGFRFYTAANGTIGAAITETERFTITQGGYVGIGAAIPAERLTVASGNIAITTAGYGLTIKEGSNARMGVATLVGGTVTVATTAVTANSRIYVTGQNLGTITVPVGYAISGRTAGADFTILSANALDTSDVSWMIVEPA